MLHRHHQVQGHKDKSILKTQNEKYKIYIGHCQDFYYHIIGVASGYQKKRKNQYKNVSLYIISKRVYFIKAYSPERKHITAKTGKEYSKVISY